MEFIAATNNPGKMAEMRRILERMGHTVRSQREAGVTLEPEENGTTFAENARIKHSGFSHIQKNKNIFLPAFHDISACIRCRSLPSPRIRLRCTEHISQNVIN